MSCAAKLFNQALLVEDDSSHALLIQRALSGFITHVDVAGSLAKALDKLAASMPEIIIADLHLPDSEGVSHIEQLIKCSERLPLIVLTSSTSLGDAVEAMKVGARDFLVKNFDTNFKELIGFSLSRIHATAALEREKRKLESEMEALRVAIENSGDGMAVVRSDGTLAYSNKSFQTFVRLWNGTTDQITSIGSEKVDNWDKVQQSLLTNFSTLSAPAVWQTEMSLKEQKQAYQLTLSVVRSNLDSNRRLQNEGVLWVRDITEEKRRERFQREILATTTHDLKGPLGAIVISADLLSEMVKGKGDKLSEIVLRVNSSAQSAINLIDEFLSARRIQEGSFILKPAVHEIDSLIKEALENYTASASAKKVALTYESIGASTVNVDRLGFIRLVGNLVSNAIKFTPRGGKVTVRAAKRGTDTYIQVQDTGCGMDSSEINKIFERFSRLEKHAQVAGSGIGLFVVKSIVDAHAGRIEVTSRTNEGTTFEVTFPHNPPVNERGELISLAFA